jgi:hypothetical protein
VPRLLDRSSGTPSASPETTTTAVAQRTPTRVPASLSAGERTIRPEQGQLSSFSRFAGKDPFVQQVRFPEATTSSGAESKGSNGKKTKTPAKPSSQGFSVGRPAAAPTMTVISVNGARQALARGARFPASDPVFVLVAEQQKPRSVVVGIAGGAYTSGSRTTKLVFGKPLVLVNTATGAKYKLVLLAVGNGQAAKPDAKAEPTPTEKASAETTP